MDKDLTALVDSVINPFADVLKMIFNLFIWRVLHLDYLVLKLVFELRLNTAHCLHDMRDISCPQSF